MNVCARCGRMVTRPVLISGVVFGWKCAAAVGGARPGRPKAQRSRAAALPRRLQAHPQQIELFEKEEG